MIVMRPFMSFYGAKWRIASTYPAPRAGQRVIEPFAGSAGFSVRLAWPDVALYDIDPAIVATWRYLIRATPGEIRKLPILNPGESVDDLSVHEEGRMLIGWWLNKGVSAPCKTMSAWGRDPRHASQFWSDRIRERIASQVDHLRGWTIEQCSYADTEDRDAYWFIDPPYANAAGRHYRHSTIDYTDLAAWCRARTGSAVVCENQGADWLPFVPHVVAKSNARTRQSHEAIWVKQ